MILLRAIPHSKVIDTFGPVSKPFYKVSVPVRPVLDEKEVHQQHDTSLNHDALPSHPEQAPQEEVALTTGTKEGEGESVADSLASPEIVPDTADTKPMRQVFADEVRCFMISGVFPQFTISVGSSAFCLANIEHLQPSRIYVAGSDASNMYDEERDVKQVALPLSFSNNLFCLFPRISRMTRRKGTTRKRSGNYCALHLSFISS